jgi:hypothetical protein
MSDDSRARLLARLAAPPPLEATRSFLRRYVSDANGIEEIHQDIARMAAINPRTLVQAAEGIDALLANPPAGGTLARIVAFDGNYVLDNPSDEGASAWLREMAGYLWNVLAATRSPEPTNENGSAPPRNEVESSG